jgi:hypothetical protein
MTAMEQIEFISVEARKLGMKYGEYVAKFGHTLPKPKKDKTKARTNCVCAICGEEFYSVKSAKYCTKCRDVEKRKGWCELCGKPIVKKHGLQRYCEDCKRVKDNEYKAKYYREKNQRERLKNENRTD